MNTQIFQRNLFTKLLHGLAILALLLCLAPPAQPARADLSPGQLDTGFVPPTMDFWIYSVYLQLDGHVFIGGAFHNVGGEARPGVAELRADGALDLTFTPGTGVAGFVRTALPVRDGTLIGGNFTDVNGTARNSIAKLDPDGALDTGFDPGAGVNGTVYGLALTPGQQILVAGDFSQAGGETHEGVARLNADGSLDPTFEQGNGADGIVYAVAALVDGKALIGGAFTSFDDSTVGNLARVMPAGGLDSSFAAGSGADGAIRAIVVQPDGKILIAGDFTTFNGVARSRIARLNADGSLDTTFDPSSGTNDVIHAMKLTPDGKIVIGGNFTNYAGTGRIRLARLNADGSLDTGFDPGTGCNQVIYSLDIQENNGKVLVGGFFTQARSEARKYLARFHADGTLDDGLDLGTGAFGGVISGMAPAENGKLWVGGQFTAFNGVARSYFIRLNANGSVDTTFDSGINGPVHQVILLSDGKLFIRGSFTAYDGAAAYKFARLNPDGTLYSAFNEASAGSMADPFNINAVVPLSNGKVLIGGNFVEYNGDTAKTVARLNADGSLDTTFSPGQGANNTVYALALQGDKIIAAGSFTTFDGVGANRIVRLNADGSVDESFDTGTGADEVIDVLFVDDVYHEIYIGGSFTTFDGAARKYIARLSNTGDLQLFNPVFNQVPRVILANDGGVFVGGDFTTVDGSTRNYLVLLNDGGEVVQLFNNGTGPDGRVDGLATQADGMLLITGSFTTYGPASAPGAARLNFMGTSVNLAEMGRGQGKVGENLSTRYHTNPCFPAPIFRMAESFLPPGLSLNAITGEISGIPTQAGIYTYTVAATNFFEDLGDAAITVVDYQEYSMEITKGRTTVWIDSDQPDPSLVGEPVVVEFGTWSEIGAHTGTVTVSDGEVECTANISVGECTLTFTTPGSKSLVATYSGDSNYDGSVSLPATHQVTVDGQNQIFLPMIQR